MFNGFLSKCNLSHRALDDVSHQLFSLQHRPDLLILIDKDLNFIKKLSIDQLVVSNKSQNLVNLKIQVLVFV